MVVSTPGSPSVRRSRRSSFLGLGFWSVPGPWSVLGPSVRGPGTQDQGRTTDQGRTKNQATKHEGRRYTETEGALAARGKARRAPRAARRPDGKARRPRISGSPLQPRPYGQY